MVLIHQRVAYAIIMYMLICAVWGLANHFRHKPVSDSYRTTLLIAEGLFIVQGLIGLVLLGEGKSPNQIMHFLYGFVGITALPALNSYIGRENKRESLWLGLTALFLCGIAVRATMTG